MGKVDETINAICEWIQKELDVTECTNKNELAEMTKALAKLVSARAHF